MGIDPEWGTRHQRDQILAFLDLQQARICRQYRVDGVHLIGQHLTQNVNIKDITLFKPVNVRK